MTYTKPEIAVLGDAASLIHGLSGNAQESNKISTPGTVQDGDLDD